MQYTIKQKPEQGGSVRPGKRLEDSTMDYNNYDRGYAEPSMNASDYMTRTYRWIWWIRCILYSPLRSWRWYLC